MFSPTYEVMILRAAFKFVVRNETSQRFSFAVPVILSFICAGSLGGVAQSRAAASSSTAKAEVVASLQGVGWPKLKTRDVAASSDGVQCDPGDTKRQSAIADAAAKSENKNADAGIVSARNDSANDQTSSATDESERELLKDGLRLSIETRYSGGDGGPKSCSIENK